MKFNVSENISFSNPVYVAAADDDCTAYVSVVEGINFSLRHFRNTRIRFPKKEYVRRKESKDECLIGHEY